MTQEELEKLTPIEVKAMVYDELVTIEKCQANIKILNSILNNKKV